MNGGMPLILIYLPWAVWGSSRGFILFYFILFISSSTKNYNKKIPQPRALGKYHNWIGVRVCARWASPKPEDL